MAVQFPVSIPIELESSGPKDYFASKEIGERFDLLPSIPDYSTFQHLSAVGKRGSELGEFYWPRGVSIQEETGHIYVADSYNHRIQISSEDGDHFIQFGEDLLCAPWGILVCGTSIFVTDRNFCAIFQFAITDYRMIERVGKKGSGDQEFNSPRNLDIFPDQHIYVADEVNDRIQILNSDLVFQGSIKHQTMTCPFDIKSAANQIFVLSCADNPCLHIFTNSGEKIRTIISRGDGRVHSFSAWMHTATFSLAIARLIRSRYSLLKENSSEQWARENLKLGCFSFQTALQSTNKGN